MIIILSETGGIDLSPTLMLFVSPYGKFYQKLQLLLVEDEKSAGSYPPVIEKQRRLRPKHLTYGILASPWSIVLHRVLEKKEPLRKVANDYGVLSHTSRRGYLRAIWKE